MRVAILSDVHANLEALLAVLERAHQERCQEMYCLGDVVGYCTSPNECIALLKEHAVRTIFGNHDLMTIGRMGFEKCNEVGIEAVKWTRGTLSDDAMAYLECLPATIRLNDVLMFHGSYESADERIVNEELAWEQFQTLAALAQETRIAFHGHTHLQSIFVAREGGQVENVAPNGMHSLDKGSRYLINPGAVGQSRSRDYSARFLVWDRDEDQVSFCQVPYDHETCARKIRAAGLRTPLHQRSFRKLRYYRRKVVKRITRGRRYDII